MNLVGQKAFHNTISKKVITMSPMKKHIKVRTNQVYDTNLIYSYVICLQSSRDISMKYVLKYELFHLCMRIMEG